MKILLLITTLYLCVFVWDHIARIEKSEMHAASDSRAVGSNHKQQASSKRLHNAASASDPWSLRGEMAPMFRFGKSRQGPCG